MKYLFIVMLAASSSSCKSQDNTFIPDRAQRSAVVTLDAPFATVFPLFGIIKEKEWSPGWDPTPVYPPSGEMAEGSVYRTPGHVHGEGLLTWVVARFDSAAGHLTYLVTSPNRVVAIDIQCAPLPENRTRATITYTLTGLTAEGNQIAHHLIARIFASDLQDWQTQINAWLKTAYRHTP